MSQRPPSSKTPELTVVLAVWGEYARFLPAKLESIRAQGVDVNIVVVDNASEPPLQVVDPSVQLVRLEEHQSLGAARNAGIALVRTRFVCIADVDDYLLPGFFATALKRIRTSGEVGWAGTYQHVDAETGEPTGRKWPRRKLPYLAQLYPPVLAWMCLLHNCIPIGGGVYRTDAVRTAGGLPVEAPLHEDWVLAAALATQGRIVLRKQVVLRYRVSTSSRSRRPQPWSHKVTAARLAREHFVRAIGQQFWSNAAMAIVEKLQLRNLRRELRKS